MKGLNLQHFKKIHEDDHSAMLQHPSGHQIRIAKKALSGPLKKQLSSLPMQSLSDGGEVFDEPNSSSVYDAQDSAPPVTTPPEPSLAEKIGSGIRTAADYATDIGPYGLMKGISAVSKSGAIHDFSKGLLGSTAHADGIDVTPQRKSPVNYDLGVNKPQQAPAVNTTATNLGQLQGDVSQFEKGANSEAQAIGQQGKAEADSAQKAEAAITKIHEDASIKWNALQSDYNAALEDVKNGHINPDHYMENKSAVGKVATAVGLILGGIGGGLTHQENPALKFLNAQIDRDIESQKANLGKKQNILTAYYHQFGNLAMAEQMAMATQKGIYATQLEKAAAESKDPVAQARAAQIAAKYKFDAHQIIGPLALKSSLMQGTQSGAMDPSLAVRILVDPKHQESAYKELGQAQSVSSLKKDSLQAFDHIANSFLNGALSPNDTRSAKQAFIGKVIKESEGRYNFEAASNLADALFPNKTDASGTVENKRERMGQLFDSMIATPILDSYGIRSPHAGSFRANSKAGRGYASR